MTARPDLKLAMTLSAALCGLAGSGVADATAVVTLKPESTTAQQYKVGASVTITAEVSGVGSADDVIVLHDVFLAYNPAVLTLTGFQWGTAMAAATPYQEAGGTTYGVYSAEPTYDPTTTAGYQLGSVGTVELDAIGDMTDTFFAGSVRLTQEALSGGAAKIWNGGLGGQDGLALFTAVFSITTSQIASSSIVLIDSGNFTDPDISYNWLTGGTQAVTDITVKTAEVDVVPVPAPLALMAAGLLGLGGVRRRLAIRA